MRKLTKGKRRALLVAAQRIPRRLAAADVLRSAKRWGAKISRRTAERIAEEISAQRLRLLFEISPPSEWVSDNTFEYRAYARAGIFWTPPPIWLLGAV